MSRLQKICLHFAPRYNSIISHFVPLICHSILCPHTHTQTGITAWAIDTRRVLTSRLNANIILTKKGPFSCVVCFVSDRERFLTIVQINHHTATLCGLGKVLFDEFHWNLTMWSGENETQARTNVITQLFNTLTNFPGSGFWCSRKRFPDPVAALTCERKEKKAEEEWVSRLSEKNKVGRLALRVMSPTP